MMKAIGLNHSFESAVADIVDNSLDAGARKVLIRFIRDSASLRSICIVDDGHGMDDKTIDRAMTVGGDRNYDEDDLGHFGIGLKAASLGQARKLTVVSRAANQPAVGRRWLIDAASKGFECDVVGSGFATSLLDRDWRHLTPSSGTIVLWTEVKSFAAIADAKALDRFIDSYLTKLRHHLGLVYHRLLAAKKVEIAVDVEDVAAGEVGLPFSVDPIDPFGYIRSCRGDYPKVLRSTWRDRPIELNCCIWPGRSNHANFKLSGEKAEPFQGFFIYRNGRLLQRGSWNGAVLPERELQLARVAIDIDDTQSALFTMNAEKTRVEASSEFGAVVQSATDGKTTFLQYLDHARSAYRDSQKRKRERPKVRRPGKGFAEAVRSAIDDEYEFLPGEALDVRWVDLGDDTFFELDREDSLIRLNRRYRSAIIGGRDSSLNDAPLVKALIYLLAEESFHGAFLGAKRKDNLAMWQSILTAAARAESK
ncbi:ATP-binding protein [Hyphomicrobium sp. LHD-15]|uniref:ATP-binding protein n=1 Tax=Hyphomicrobium sp. LHD-15 TaxID=3072142 RepID=UPI00280E1CCA|nr:ATP-binding protein [Hyphomicrobium sp. LHD-15]MDQ8698166.1 ATP-binding protein [Hyphomicrobium sp. LHD-15]